MDDKTHEHHTVLERKELTARQVHAALRLEGEEELKSASPALFLSAVACGTTLGLTLVARGVLQSHLPDAAWRPIVASLGYPAGFVAIVLARQELYTGNTLTALLPYLEHPRRQSLLNVGRVWSVVLAGNLIGAALFAWAAAWTTAFDASLRATFTEIGQHAASYGFATAFAKGVFGGWLIALMIWLMPGAHHARIWVILLAGWILAASELTHVVAGSVEVLFSVFAGALPLSVYLTGYAIPVLLGNTAGAVLLVAVLNHLQVASDTPPEGEASERVVISGR
jgi:formate/nitrite transporter FocA (FNT family)